MGYRPTISLYVENELVDIRMYKDYNNRALFLWRWTRFTEQGLFKNSNNPCYPNKFIIRANVIDTA